MFFFNLFIYQKKSFEKSAITRSKQYFKNLKATLTKMFSQFDDFNKCKISEVLMILSMFISLSSAKFNIWNLV